MGKHRYVCKECSEEFSQWKLCHKHLNATGHLKEHVTIKARQELCMVPGPAQPGPAQQQRQKAKPPPKRSADSQLLSGRNGGGGSNPYALRPFSYVPIPIPHVGDLPPPPLDPLHGALLGLTNGLYDHTGAAHHADSHHTAGAAFGAGPSGFPGLLAGLPAAAGLTYGQAAMGNFDDHDEDEEDNEMGGPSGSGAGGYGSRAGMADALRAGSRDLAEPMPPGEEMEEMEELEEMDVGQMAWHAGLPGLSTSGDLTGKAATAAAAAQRAAAAAPRQLASSLPPLLPALSASEAATQLQRYFHNQGGLSGGNARASSLLDRGCVLADRVGAQTFREAALLGVLTGPHSDGLGSATPGSPSGFNGGEGARDDSSGRREVYLNTHEPFCLAAVGVQGGGKSHTMACVLEACLVPFPECGVVQLQRPMSVLVLHYDQNVSSVCEATGLISPIHRLARLLSGSTASTSAAPPPRCLPRENMVVLVSPSYWRQRKAFYGDYCIVKPLLFRWASLSADHIKKIMRIKDSDNQLYMASLLDLLRKYQQAAVTPSFPAFILQVRQLCNIKGQEGPLVQRLRLLESVVAESAGNAALAAESGDLYSCVKPGVMVVADLTDPLLASDEANGIFHVLTEQYRAIPCDFGSGSGSGSGGKLLALDEAHKFMDASSSGDGLSEAIVNVARLMRHDGMRLAVSTQSPSALAPELLELVTVAVLHRFHSRDWFTYLAKKLPLPDSSWEQLMDLQPGHALVFASQHRVQAVSRRVTSGAWRSTDGALNGEDDDAAGARQVLARNHVFQLHVRPRITADRGATRVNAAAGGAGGAKAIAQR